jgi:hypothetical protein
MGKGNKNKKTGHGLNDKHKLFVDTLFINNFDQGAAYRTVFGTDNVHYSHTSSSRLMGKSYVKDYYNHKIKEYRKSLDITKEKMIDKLMEELNLFDEIKALARKDVLTIDEINKLDRLGSILKASDANKSRDMINKLIGSYEPEKQEIEHTGMVFNYITPTKKEDDNE